MRVCKFGCLKEVNWLRVGSGDAIGMAKVSYYLAGRDKNIQNRHCVVKMYMFVHILLGKQN